MGVFGKIKDGAKKGIDKSTSAKYQIEQKRENKELKKQEEDRIEEIVINPLTCKFTDLCTATGFQFRYYCEICDYEYTTRFYESDAGKAGSKLKIIGKSVNVGASVTGKLNPVSFIKGGDDGLGSKGEGLVDEFAKKYDQYSPKWHNDRAKYFEIAQEEAKKYFNKCPKCELWSCEYCWDPKKELCKEDSKYTIVCPNCKEQPGTGKFCLHCGTPQKLTCKECNAVYDLGVKFCGECGKSLNRSK